MPVPIEERRKKYEENHVRKKVTFKKKEYDRLLHRFAKSGERNLNQFIKKCALQTQLNGSHDNVFYKQMTAQIRRVGNNINQIAYQLNAQTGGLNSETIQSQLERLQKLMEKIKGKNDH